MIKKLIWKLNQKYLSAKKLNQYFIFQYWYNTRKGEQENC